MSMAPMYVIGAKRVSMDTLRIVFMVPDPDKADIMDGNGALLELSNFNDLRVGDDTALRPSMLEAFFETLVEGDENTPGKGPIPCGIGIAGGEVQLVEYDSGTLILKCCAKYMKFLTDIDITQTAE